MVRTYQERPQSHLDWHARPSVRMLIVGSEPVSIEAIDKFNGAFAPHSLPPNAFKPSYGNAEATLFVSTIAPDASATVVHLDRAQLASGRAVPVTADAPSAVAHVSCGQVARSQWAVIVNPETERKYPTGESVTSGARRQRRPRLLGAA